MVHSTDDLLNLSPHIGQRASTVRFDVLSSQLDVIGEVQPDQDQPATVSNNINRTIKRDITGMVLNSSQAGDINPYTQRIRPVWVLENGVEFHCGVFLLIGLDRARHEWGLVENVSGVDQTFILDQPIEKGVSYGKGASVNDALETQFAVASIPAFEVDSGITSKIGSPISWPAGVTRLRVINDLAAIGGAYSAYFDNNGVGRVSVVPPTSESTPEIVYEAGTSSRIINSSMVETDSGLDAPNRYIVIDSSNPDLSIVGYFDVPDDDLGSFANRGFIVAEVINEQGLESVTEANARARSAYLTRQGGLSWVQFSSPPDPRHDTFDAIQYLGRVYREQGWSLPLIEGSEMTHDLRRSHTGEEGTVPA